MEAKDLRIGNLIMDRGGKEWLIHCWESRNKVASKPTKLTGEILGRPIYGHPLTEYVEYLKPIPITEEWLVKLGFDEFIYLSDEYFSNDVITLINYQNDRTFKGWYVDGMFDNESAKIEIKHIHQLQNLYFALTQTELKINNHE